jgi:Trypsin-like peptidase domain
VGDDILVAGNPEGLEASFSRGIVSGIRSVSGLIQMDAAISPGSSGGPVVNRQGEVIGLAVATLVEGQNLNFSVPIRYLREQKLTWNLAVRILGAVSVTDVEDEGFHGPIKTVTESVADYSPGETDNSYVEGPSEPARALSYSQEGRLEEYTVFQDGKEVQKSTWKYSEDGFIKEHRLSMADSGKNLPYEVAHQLAPAFMAASRSFDEIVPNGKKGERHYREDTYDRSGHLVEKALPEQGIRTVIKYDSLGRETESLEYRHDKLYSTTRSSYEVNQRGDWIKRHETCWFASSPDKGFVPFDEYYREITYYGDEGR